MWRAKEGGWIQKLLDSDCMAHRGKAIIKADSYRDFQTSLVALFWSSSFILHPTQRPGRPDSIAGTHSLKWEAVLSTIRVLCCPPLHPVIRKQRVKKYNIYIFIFRPHPATHHTSYIIVYITHHHPYTSQLNLHHISLSKVHFTSGAFSISRCNVPLYTQVTENVPAPRQYRVLGSILTYAALDLVS